MFLPPCRCCLGTGSGMAPAHCHVPAGICHCYEGLCGSQNRSQARAQRTLLLMWPAWLLPGMPYEQARSPGLGVLPSGCCTTQTCQAATTMAAAKTGTKQVMNCCQANPAEGQACSSCQGMRPRGEWWLSLFHILSV